MCKLVYDIKEIIRIYCSNCMKLINTFSAKFRVPRRWYI